MDKRYPTADSTGFVKLAYEVVARLEKSASGFEYISDVPAPGGRFANNRLEQDYQMKNPALTTLHPAIYGGAMLGAVTGAIAHKNIGGLEGAVLGGMAGLGAEALHRYHYLTQARDQLRHGNNPVDKRYQF